MEAKRPRPLCSTSGYSPSRTPDDDIANRAGEPTPILDSLQGPVTAKMRVVQVGKKTTSR